MTRVIVEKGIREGTFYFHGPDGFSYHFNKFMRGGRASLRVHPVAAAHWHFVKLRPSMDRARASTLPPIPHTLSELAAVLEDQQYSFLTKTLDSEDFIFLGKFGQTRDRTRVLIFISRRLMAFMSRMKEVMSDATFSSVPAALDCAQVWTILALRRNHIVPLVRVLMQSKLQACYTVALTALKTAMPTFNPRKVNCDFETAQSNAWLEVFPHIEVNGCLFHSSKAIAGHAKSIGLAIIIRDNEEVDKAR
ncbi:uncharacterized protein LOC117644041 [Thrips palmi]|uniref:Uncharacterized protein LOC117644041 n=1 Tax=Thrips palmi TaxID=161013 RepID=A0A6P8YXZ9_THRPL|nr:uncharacterized protein LOC117644041 [Thrips palmi]